MSATPGTHLPQGDPQRSAQSDVPRFELSTEETSSKSEKLFAAFMDHLPGFAWMKDLNGRYVYANKNLREFGPYRKGWLGKTDADLWPEEIASAYRGNDQQVAATRKAIQAVEPYLVDEEECFVLVSKFPIFDDTRKVCMVGGVSVDISERSRTETALRENEIRFRQIAENISEVFWVWTAKQDASLLYVSPAYETIWGRSCESLYASPQSWREALHPEDKEWVLKEIAALDLKSPNDITYRIVRPDHSIRWIRDRIFPVRDASGAVVRFTGIAEDITESKLAADVVRESEAKFRQLLGSNIVGVVFWTLKGDIVDANDLFLRTVGYSRDDLRAGNLNWRDMTPPEYGAIDENAIDQLLATGTCAPFEKEYMRKDGRKVLVLIGSALLDSKMGSGSSFIMDITGRKEGEAALKKVNRQLRILSRQRIQVQEDERRRLSRELHDQIGQLLTAGNLNLQSARRSRSRQAIHKKLDETIDILEQILQKARQISFDIRPPVLDDLGLAPALRWMLDDSATRAGISSEFFCDPDLRRADVESETACYRVASEAVSNVVRHAKAGKVWLELLNAGKALQLLVRDNGIGFDVADAEKRVTRDRLGLVGMRERAIAVGGQFECKSAPGHGTEVRALFPISSERD